ncbi:DUF6588 family protein [Echinicola sp. 20G]|uniref:DUF6588 family protein n=1 Tax=Echinicola sp. 20G TaxID=2781961 RepID=UPI001910BEB3|nr:DUF6588 family protein [Echinicola sp. 20G]
MKKILSFCLVGLLLSGTKVFGQGDIDVEKILQAGVDDLNTYMGYYVEPAAKGFIYSMGTGWAHTAKTHSTLGFDLKFSVSGARVPARYENFTFDPSEYEKLRVKGSNGATSLPTLYGDPDASGTLEIYEEGMLIAEVDIPPGLDIPVKYVPAPTIQGAIGLPAGFELIGRFIPKVSVEDAEISQWGLGVKHDIKQHIPGIKILPFDLSILAAYNSLNAKYFIEEDMGQFGEMSLDTWTFQALVSKKLSILTVYGTVGYNTGSSTYDMLGTYSIEGTSESITDPVNLEYNAKGAMATLGARFKFGPVFLNGDYTFQEFNTVSVGLGVAIR